jgi:hypothetical protein
MSRTVHDFSRPCADLAIAPERITGWSILTQCHWKYWFPIVVSFGNFPADHCWAILFATTHPLTITVSFFSKVCVILQKVSD